MSPLDWLYQAATTSSLLVGFALWCAGCVVALRHSPRPGTTLAATGFGLLALQALIGLAVQLTVYVLARTGWLPNSPFLYYMQVIGGIQAIIHITGILLLVIGVSKAWSTSWNDDLAVLRPVETGDLPR